MTGLKTSFGLRHSGFLFFLEGVFNPADSSALGHGPKKALIRARAASSKSDFWGSDPSSSAFRRSC